MPFVIPNATDTTGSNRYNSLDQAEPDSLDFQLLGSRSTGVLSGGEVTPQTVANYTVAISSGHVLLNGVVYAISSNPALALPTVPSGNRFDLIVARLVSGSMVLTSVSGPDSASNPSFPPTPNQMTTIVGVPTNNWINPDTDVVLAAVLRAGAANITRSHIVDKRLPVTASTLRGDSVPANTFGNDGDLYYKTPLLGDAGLYVKLNGVWTQVGTGTATPVAPTPVGAVITWVSSTANPDTASWLECIGQEVSRTVYSSLFSVIGTAYGAGDGSTTFKLPDFRGHFLMGLPSGRSVATAYGAINNEITLTTSQIPQHNHPVGTLDMVENGAHTHTTETNGNPNFREGIMLRSSLSTTAFGSLTVQPAGEGFTLGIGTTNSRGSHKHTITGNTGNTGSGTTVNIEPRNYAVRYFIKYA